LSNDPLTKHKKMPLEMIIICAGLVCYLVCTFCFHGTWTASEAYSHPTIIMSYNDKQGGRHIVDDYREAYYWLRKNTKQDAKVLSWWDYGYQVAGMANRTTIIDNNTWNKTHISHVGMILASREEEAYEYVKQMDVDYMMVIFGGYAKYSGDDINKFLWIIRIAGNENQHIKEADY